MNNSVTGRPSDSPHTLLYVFTVVAVALGIWGRFKGLGSLPLGADEYYIARSVEDILRTGLPEFDCGGFYTRGILFQYIVAFLQLAGMSAELSARSVAAVASLIVLPAVYILGRRVHGPTVGLLAVSVLALSVWEVDVARFGRMYAPFQAVFAWYLVYFVRYTVDGDPRALRPMLILSLVGVLTWEGGVLMTFANLLPAFIRNPNGAFVARDFRYLAFCAAIVVAAYLFTSTNFRHLGTEPFPSDFDTAEFVENLDEGNTYRAFTRSAGETAPEPHFAPVVAIGLVLLTFAAASLRWIWSFRYRWPAAIGLVIALAAALAHQFSLAIFALTIMLLMRILTWREFCARDARPFVIAMAVSLVGWTAIGILSPSWLASLDVPWGESSTPLKLAYEFLRLPDFVGIVALSFARAAPILGAVLFAAIVFAVLGNIRRDTATVTTEQVLLLIIVCLLGAATFGHPPRLEIRYFIFLFPATVIIAVTIAVQVVRRFASGPIIATLITTAVVVIGFTLTGDFQLHRLIYIDETHSRLGRLSTPGHRLKVMRRPDARAAAQWLAEHANSPQSLVINGYPTVDFYFRDFDFAYIALDNHRFWTYSCQRGTVERWGNLPLLKDAAGLLEQIDDSERTYIVIDTPSSEKLIRDLAIWRPTVEWTSLDGYITILVIDSRPDHDRRVRPS